MSSGSGIGSHSRIRAGVDAERDFGREEVVGDAHLVAIGVGAERQQRRVLRLPAEAADAPLAGRDVDDHARRGRSRRRGRDRPDPRARRIVSSSIASTSPAPNSGIGTRRAMTLASAGITGWQAWPGIENRWNSVSPAASSGSERRRRRRGAPARTSAIGADAADRRHVVADGAAGAVERRPQSFLGGFDLEEVLEAEPELLELRRREARQRIAGQRRRATAREHDRAPPRTTSVRPRRSQAALIATGAGVGHDDHAAHEGVAGAAQLRALEGVAAGFLRP